MSEYTDWHVEDTDGALLISANREGGVNPALVISVLKDKGSVMIQGSPALTAVGCDGAIHSFRGTVSNSMFTGAGNVINGHSPLKEKAEE